MNWPADDRLSAAVSLGHDFAGFVSFADLVTALDHRRHRIVTCIYRPSSDRYEVVLQVIV